MLIKTKHKLNYLINNKIIMFDPLNRLNFSDRHIAISVRDF